MSCTLNCKPELDEHTEMCIKSEVLHLFIDDRLNTPFHCDIHGFTYEPCYHWGQN